MESVTSLWNLATGTAWQIRRRCRGKECSLRRWRGESIRSGAELTSSISLTSASETRPKVSLLWVILSSLVFHTLPVTVCSAAAPLKLPWARWGWAQCPLLPSRLCSHTPSHPLLFNNRDLPRAAPGTRGAAATRPPWKALRLVDHPEDTYDSLAHVSGSVH